MCVCGCVCVWVCADACSAAFGKHVSVCIMCMTRLSEGGLWRLHKYRGGLFILPGNYGGFCQIWPTLARSGLVLV